MACSPDVHRSVKFSRAFLLTVQYRRHYLATAELLLFCCRGSAMYVMSVVCVLKRVSGFPSYAVRPQAYSQVPLFFLRFPSLDPFVTSSFRWFFWGTYILVSIHFNTFIPQTSHLWLCPTLLSGAHHKAFQLPSQSIHPAASPGRSSSTHSLFLLPCFPHQSLLLPPPSSFFPFSSFLLSLNGCNAARTWQMSQPLSQN